MPLNKTQLASDIEKHLSDFQAKSEDDKAKTTPQDLANAIATAVDTYVKGITVTVAGVATAGSATAQAQTAPVTATVS